MRKSKSIRIEIPEPCGQNWHEMTAVYGGHFCGKCERTVVDFTSYSDIELYNFFRKKENEYVCGRYLAQQLNRDIIPVQQHSRLYKLFIALGLSLIFLPVTNSYAHPPAMYISPSANDEDKAADTSANLALLSGTVTDENGDAMIGALIKILSGGLAKGGALTNEDGFFEILTLEPGRYTVEVYSRTYFTQRKEIIIQSDSRLQLNFKMVLSDKELNDMIIITGYRVPLIDRFTPADKK